jgi:hypothetical protein
VDVWVSRNSWLRAIAFSSGNLMKRQERHPSIGVLKDGRRLTGYFYWEEARQNHAKVCFEPLTTQPDGSRWVNIKAVKDPGKLPSCINVYSEDLLDKASYTATPPEGAGLEPAIVKILLGISYWTRGKDAVMLSGFDAMRNCLSGDLDPRVSVTWIDSLEVLKSKGLPFDVKINDHTVWGECPDGFTFLGAVSLFGRVIAEIKCRDFGASLPGRCATFENPWVPC